MTRRGKSRFGGIFYALTKQLTLTLVTGGNNGLRLGSNAGGLRQQSVSPHPSHTRRIR